MDAQTLDATFGVGFSPVKSFDFNFRLNAPSHPGTALDADVMEQFYRVDATWGAQTGRLRFGLNPQGDGLWSPSLGNGAGAGGGTTAKGWGTYSCALDNTVEWVATGRFSGCHIGLFGGGGGTRIAHLITPGDGDTAASVEGQIDAIEQATGSTLVHREQPWSVERRTPLTR